MRYPQSAQTATASTVRPMPPDRLAALHGLLRRGFAANPWLMLFGLAMIGTLVATSIGLLADPRVITGAPAWLKPTKFAISISIYSFTFVWLLSSIHGHRRLVNLVTVVTALGLAIEMAIIILQVVRGTTSHFNVSTPLDATLFQVMGSLIVLVWVGLLTAVLLVRQRMTDPVFAWGMRLGIVIALVGMGVAFLMPVPTGAQIALLQAGQTSATLGAHSVGVADGGPGLPFLGWSTVGGDLRIPHFFGLHGLQVLPFLGWLLTRRRFAGVGAGQRVALVGVAGGSYLGLIGLLTWQALRGQSIVAPDTLTLQALAALITAAALAGLGIAVHARCSVALRQPITPAEPPLASTPSAKRVGR